MKLTDLISSASSSLLRSKARTLLTIIAIFIGAMTITLTNGIGTGVKTYLNQQIGNLGATNVLEINLKNPNTSLNGDPVKFNPNQKFAVSGNGRFGQTTLLMNSSDVAKISKINNITSVLPARALTVSYIQGTGEKYQASVVEQYGISTADMLSGKGVNNQSTANQVSIPNNFLNALGYSSASEIVNKTVTLGIANTAGSITDIQAVVTGVQQEAVIGTSPVYVNNTLANQLYNIQSQGLPASVIDSFTTVQATFPNNLNANQIQTIKNTLNSEGYSGQTIKDRENTVFTALNVIIIVLDMFGGIALLAASFGIINTLFMSVAERTKEIGLMKALGMSPRRIFMLFSIEAILIGFWGSILGVLFASLIGKIVNTIAVKGFLKNFPGLTLLTFPLTTIAIVVAGIMVLAFIAGTLPALKASRKDPIEALRYE